ncbi:hypothetical protein E2562_023030 [Oryza meyeriana var. granulata]|uniref:Uncharacterized protein n=1 Tax=Oryza meyeriana var. granulata TaxID=110450 RepID=A0A6G1EYN1_9ORYZ|nr:hypothetical protein E2562_023030 [Oryza meyeriana var. granulata]
MKWPRGKEAPMVSSSSGREETRARGAAKPEEAEAAGNDGPGWLRWKASEVADEAQWRWQNTARWCPSSRVGDGQSPSNTTLMWGPARPGAVASCSGE